MTSAIAQFYGAQSLKPEESDNYGVGFVFNPTEKIELTADLYRIDVSDRIYISQTFNVTAADIAALPELAAVGVGGDVQYFTNSLDTKTTGRRPDRHVSHRPRRRRPRPDPRLQLQRKRGHEVRPGRDHGPMQIITAERLAPNHRANLQAGWTVGNWAVNVIERYYSDWRDENDYPGQVFGAKFTTDLDVSYTFMEKYMLTVGASNLFDARPDKIAQSDTNPVFPIVGGLADGQVYPRNGGPFGINGAFWYMTLRINFAGE